MLQIGAHQCPGVPLAELVGRTFLVRWVEQFSSWTSANEKDPEFELIPIKIPLDNFKLKLETRG